MSDQNLAKQRVNKQRVNKQRVNKQRVNKRRVNVWSALIILMVLLHLAVACTPNSPESSNSNELQSTDIQEADLDTGVIDAPMKEMDPLNDSPESSEETSESETELNQNFESSPYLLLGKGAREFVAIDDGEISTLHRGCQGAQHLWVSLRLPMHAPDAYALELQLVDEQNELLAPPFTLTEEFWLAYEDSNEGTMGSEIIGLTLVIFDPTRVVGNEALVKAKVTVDDQVLESRVWVEVQWGADAC